MFGPVEDALKIKFETLDAVIKGLKRRLDVLEHRNAKEDRGDFLPATGHSLDEITNLKQKLKEATDENHDLTDHIRHLQRRVHDYLDNEGRGPNPSGDPNTGDI